MDGDFVSGSGGVAVQRSAFVVPALRKEREGRGTHFVGDISEVKNLGHPSHFHRLAKLVKREKVADSTQVMLSIGDIF